MQKAAILACFLTVISISTACADDYCKSNLVLETESGKVIFFVKYKNADQGIIEGFYTVFENEGNKSYSDKIVILENGIIRDKSGVALLDFSGHQPGLYGVMLHLSYPQNKRFTPGILIDPYFGSSSNVGDTQRI